MMNKLRLLLLSIAALMFGGCQSPAVHELGTPPAGSELWAGTWSSDDFTNVHGDVAIHLPENFTSVETFEVPAAVHYRLFTFYRPGGTVRLTMRGSVSESMQSVGDNEAEPIRVPHRWISIFSTRASDGDTEQIIRYEAELLPDADVLEGEYVSTDPSDHGTFRLRRRHHD